MPVATGGGDGGGVEGRGVEGRDTAEQAQAQAQAPERQQQQEEEEELTWDWSIDQADRAREAAADGDTPFPVDRHVLRDVVRERMGEDVVRISFISSGTFHKAYLLTLASRSSLIARVARRFMPRLKTESEVATLAWLRAHTDVPVPQVLSYDASPYNRLGGEWMLMSKAQGIPLAQVYHALPHATLVALLRNLAEMLIPLFGFRFGRIGSLYMGRGPEYEETTKPTNALPTPKPHAFLPHQHHHPEQFQDEEEKEEEEEFHVGPIISWPFFGSARGDLPSSSPTTTTTTAQPPPFSIGTFTTTLPSSLPGSTSDPGTTIDRGPWPSTSSYLSACAAREVGGVRQENEGRAKPHRLHLDPDDRGGVIGWGEGEEEDDDDDTQSSHSFGSDSDEDVLYRDYRRFQRSTFLVAHLVQREEAVGREMEVFARVMKVLEGVFERDMRGVGGGGGGGGGKEGGEFALDCHDLSLENVFVDERDHSKITCIIDWESTTTRPLWAAAHLPSFLLSSPSGAAIFRSAVAAIARGEHPSSSSSSSPPSSSKANRNKNKLHPARLRSLANQWLVAEERGAMLRAAHRFVEWDGWEEGLVHEVLAPLGVDFEREDLGLGAWVDVLDGGGGGGGGVQVGDGSAGVSGGGGVNGIVIDGSEPRVPVDASSSVMTGTAKVSTATAVTLKNETAKKPRTLSAEGDECGGRGGELGARLQAWLSVATDRRGSYPYSCHEDAEGEDGGESWGVDGDLAVEEGRYDEE
ncbi:hypothetical protein BD410DRAFT_734132 [Rickenella mellea]|uniref:Aminoglycoside phosphotransferase domain-containing protein n=1 Tax=Rickenella mellea TaxID=50990 RepID=A0A4Y7PIP3_9AGAM|nr:hypothetical protein BD410DRAFT_734132 [Rickenella mellea]